MAKIRGKAARSVGASQQDLKDICQFLWEASKQSAISIERNRLRWAADCISSFLDGAAPTLDHAFGLVKTQGNQGKVRIWAEREAAAKRENLSVAQVAARYNLSDEKSVREGLKRGREINERQRAEDAANKIAARLAAHDDAELAKKKQDANREMRANGIKFPRRRRGAN